LGVSSGEAVGEAVGEVVGEGETAGEADGEGVGVTEDFGTGTIAATSRPSFFSSGTINGCALPREKNNAPRPAPNKTRPPINNTNLIEEDIFQHP
jgi:hypothetical protein